jgi:phage repressor protein C with HTH and peptisase S24 domain
VKSKTYKAEDVPTESGNELPSSVSFDQGFSARMAEVIESVGSLGLAGMAAGVTDEQVARWRDLKAKPNVFALARLAMSAGFSLDWLVTGLASKRPFPLAPERINADGSVVWKEPLPLDFQLIPRLDVSPSAGSGTLVEVEEQAEVLAFRSDWMRRRGINPATAHALTARGDSMEPTIRDGDVLLVDTSIDYVKDNAIYIVVFSGRTLVKRLQMLRDGSVAIKSDNKDVFDDEVVPPNEVPDIQVAGRVMWYGRSI